jgi:hypothetical protein
MEVFCDPFAGVDTVDAHSRMVHEVGQQLWRNQEVSGAWISRIFFFEKGPEK